MYVSVGDPDGVDVGVGAEGISGVSVGVRVNSGVTVAGVEVGGGVVRMGVNVGSGDSVTVRIGVAVGSRVSVGVGETGVGGNGGKKSACPVLI